MNDYRGVLIAGALVTLLGLCASLYGAWKSRNAKKSRLNT
jgi:hypothetical protein